MKWDFLFFFNSFLLGIGLAMDAFSVSMANGLHEPQMSESKKQKIAITFGVFQMLMPLIGWFCVHTILNYFRVFEKFIPWIALALLGYIGGKMLLEGIRSKENEADETGSLSGGELFVQGIATAIDALSVGFTIENYGFPMAFTASFIIGFTTYLISLAGVEIGKKFGTKLSGRASILGGVILSGIGLEIFIKGVIF